MFVRGRRLVYKPLFLGKPKNAFEEGIARAFRENNSAQGRHGNVRFGREPEKK
jgi:hypothetical protein